MRKNLKGRIIGFTVILLAGLLAAGAVADQHGSEAAEEISEEPIQLQELVVVGVGTRSEGRTVVDSPVPVDVVTEEEILETGEAELGRVIQALIPSFNFSSSTISDGTDSVRPATLRGMGPDQVLVLVNGKRRHASALIHVNRSVGRGTAGTDLNAIPVSAIKRIEVLRDGASAQYGSDAVAGVINIILKDSYDGALHTSVGQTYESDGTRYTVRLNKGFQVGDDGVLHAALEFSHRGATNRASLSGHPQYPEWFPLDHDGLKPNGKDIDNRVHWERNRALNDMLLGQGHPEGTFVALDEGNLDRERNFQRRNFRIGDAELDQFSSAFNYSNRVEGLGAEVYAFGDFSTVQNESGGFYRRANQSGNNPPGSIYLDGFLPLINTTVSDFSIGGGILREFENSIKADLAVVHGGNSFNFEVMNSHNASWVNCALGNEPAACGNVDFMVSQTPTSADAGTLRLDLTTVNLDFSWPLLDSLHVAWGAEYRLDRYRIEAGEEYSYLDYDGGATGAIGGIQVFPGFGPDNEVNETRDAFSLYVDTELYVSDALLVSPAVRFENFSDFGTTINGKLAAKLDINAQFALRGSVSSGFRAPSMQQLYFNNVSTQFVTLSSGEVVGQEVGTFRNDSSVAKGVGIPDLEEETSINVSGGFVYQPVPSLTVTTDFYHIEIDDRIIVSGFLEATDEGLPSAVRTALVNDGIQRAQFFMNAADTRTQGVDVVIVWDVPEMPRGDLGLKLLGTTSETTITSVNLPASLPSLLFDDRGRSIIEEWQPDYRFTLSGSYRLDRFSAFVALHGYGPYTVSNDGNDPLKQEHDPKYLTDLRLGYDLGFGTLSIGAKNLFDVTPDENEIERSRNGTIIDPNGNLIVDSPRGVFTYSRRSAPFGFNGGFYYLAYDVEF